MLTRGDGKVEEILIQAPRSLGASNINARLFWHGVGKGLADQSMALLAGHLHPVRPVLDPDCPEQGDHVSNR